VDGPRVPVLLRVHSQVRRLGLRHPYVGNCYIRSVQANHSQFKYRFEEIFKNRRLKVAFFMRRGKQYICKLII
jgi:hypothetical protein